MHSGAKQKTPPEVKPRPGKYQEATPSQKIPNSKGQLPPKVAPKTSKPTKSTSGKKPVPAPKPTEFSGLNPADRWNWGTNAAHYIKELEVRSGFPFRQIQKGHLADAMRTGNFRKLSVAERLEHSKPFKNTAFKNKLIKEWEVQTGQKWPKYSSNVYSKGGNLIGQEGSYYPAHHIIPQQFEGPHKWWNIKPLHVVDHIKVHSSGVAPLKSIVKGVK